MNELRDTPEPSQPHVPCSVRTREQVGTGAAPTFQGPPGRQLHSSCRAACLIPPPGTLSLKQVDFWIKLI